MLTVCASSTDTDLTTTGFLRSLIGTSSTAQDALLSAYIRAASRWAESYLGYPLSLQSYQETVAGYGRLQMMLKRTPVRAVDSMFDATDSGGNQVNTSEFTLEDREAGLLTRSQGWDWTPLMEGHSFDAAVPLTLTPIPGEELRPWLVSYRAGWVYGGVDTGSNNWSTVKGSTSTGRTLPEDVELAVALRAKAFYDGGDEAASERLDDLTVNYRSLGTDKDGMLMTRSRDLLDHYRRWA